MRTARSNSTLWLSALLGPFLVWACEPTATDPVDDFLTLTTLTSGASFDANGYFLHIDGGEAHPIGITDKVHLPAPARTGDLVVELIDVASNCEVHGSNPMTVQVGTGGGVPVDFLVECFAVSRDITFSSERNGNVDLYALGSDGGHTVRLTTAPTQETEPDWSPDGQKIAFSSWIVGSNTTRIFHMNADGSGPQFIHFGHGDPSWSSDGTRIAFTWENQMGFPGDLDMGVWMVNADGSEPRFFRPGTSPVWSPDGRMLAFTHWETPPEFFAWPEPQIRIVDTDSPHETTVALEADGASWSPDGTRIAFTSYRDGDAEIYVVDPDGSNLERLTSHPSRDYAPAWSPDGARVAFTSDRDGNEEIYLINVDGSGLVNLTNHPAPDRAPAWSTAR